MRLLRTVLLAASTALCGCQSGLLYTHTFEPLSTNFDKTPVFKKTQMGESDVKHLSIPTPYHSLDILWDSNAIGDAAARDGIEEICYADIETLSFFFEVWSQQTVHVYGRVKAAPKN